MKFTIYSLWIDYTFYVYVAVFIAAMTSLLFGIRKLMEMNAAEEERAAPEDIVADGLAAPAEEFPQEPPREQPAAAPAQQENLFTEPEPQSNPGRPSPAEEFIKNLYTAISKMDDRMKNIEKNMAVAKPRTANNEFIVKFLEDIMNDYDALDKEKVKARIQFLLSDLKKQ
ncbi:MAG: hypothetical protein COT17_04900 [Elusimicrobia bacterium CG08_land_8_20_14_0_20_51_18]|nr:MAG: hypothetical protein COT17_04900 [Elusimicrobia bacterium CG08_land_8_20_14_0_20_51_18]